MRAARLEPRLVVATPIKVGRMHNRTCLCHFPDGSDGVYSVEYEYELLRGSVLTIVGLEGAWVVTEMDAPDEAEVIDAEIWVTRPTLA